MAPLPGLFGYPAMGQSLNFAIASQEVATTAVNSRSVSIQALCPIPQEFLELIE